MIHCCRSERDENLPRHSISPEPVSQLPWWWRTAVTCSLCIKGLEVINAKPPGWRFSGHGAKPVMGRWHQLSLDGRGLVVSCGDYRFVFTPCYRLGRQQQAQTRPAHRSIKKGHCVKPTATKGHSSLWSWLAILFKRLPKTSQRLRLSLLDVRQRELLWQCGCRNVFQTFESRINMEGEVWNQGTGAKRLVPLYKWIL